MDRSAVLRRIPFRPQPRDCEICYSSLRRDGPVAERNRRIPQRNHPTGVQALPSQPMRSISTLSLLISGTACVAFGALGGLSACGGGSSSDPPPSSGALGNALSVQATDLGTASTNPDILGRDEAYSAAFQGYSVWLYGDTALQKPDASGRTFLSNTWSYTSDLDASHGITGFQERADSAGSPSMLLQETPDEYSFNLEHYGDTCQVQPCGVRWAIWPSTIITDPVSTHALVFYTVQSVDQYGKFQGVGGSVAIWQSFDQLPQRPTFSPVLVVDHPDLMFSQSDPSFGSAAVISNGVLYVYGCGNDTDGLDKGCRLGKVNPANVQDRTTWTFYSGSGRWSSSVSDATPVFNGLDILSVSWNNYLQRYIAVYSSLFSQNVMLRTASAPEGPWSDELLAFTALSPASGNTYDAQAHSEFDAHGGQTIYVTYSRSLAAGGSEVRLVAVQLQTTGTLP